MLQRIILATALLLTTSLTALAGTGSSGGDSDCAKARQANRACNLVFDGDTLSGDRATGDGDVLAVADSAIFSNLITVRTSFRDLIVQSAEDL